MTTTQPATQPVTPARSSRDDQSAAAVVAFLGTGRMGGPMAANLARAGFDVRVWNRTISRAQALVPDGAIVAGSPAEAVRGATVVITMLTDGSATEQAAAGPDGFLAAAKDVIWVQMGTVGTEWTARLAGLAAHHGAVLVDAPVSGSEGPARVGQLTVLASGPEQVRDVLAPVFGVLGRATVWLGPAGNGTRAKLVLNNWLADLTETTAENLSFARRLGLDPAQIVDLLQSNPLGALYAVQRPASCWPATSAPRSRSSTPSRTPSSRRRPPRRPVPLSR